MNSIVALLQEHPELALFICLGAGYWIGGLKIAQFSLGTVVGTLVVALIVGQADVSVPDFVKTLFFALFMFSIGYHVGPQFFNGLRKGGLTMMAVSLVFLYLRRGYGFAHGETLRL